jgi:hypothetical protein
VTAVNWLVSLPWPIFLAIWLPALALLGAGLLRLGNWACDQAARRRPRARVTGWHGHECGCICTDKIMPCPGHKGQAAAVLHRSRP